MLTLSVASHRLGTSFLYSFQATASASACCLRTGMAPNLNPFKRELLEGMVLNREHTDTQIAKQVQCSTRTVRAARSNIRCFKSIKAPFNGGGRSSAVTPLMRIVLFDHLHEHPGLYQDEMIVFLWDEFEVLVSKWSIRRALQECGWSKKNMRRVSREQNADLRDLYHHRMSEFCSYHLVFVDESGCDKRIGFRRTGWAPLGITPVQIVQFQRGWRYHILPAYAQDGVVLAQIFQGSTHSDVFENFLRELLPLCGRWPEPKSVLIKDNASLRLMRPDFSTVSNLVGRSRARTSGLQHATHVAGSFLQPCMIFRTLVQRQLA